MEPPLARAELKLQKESYTAKNQQLPLTQQLTSHESLFTFCISICIHTTSSTRTKRFAKRYGATFVAPGMVGKVLSLHPKEEMRQAVEEMLDQPMAKRALVEFENGM